MRTALLLLLLPAFVLADPSEKALRYHQALRMRPQPGTVLDRFVDAWLENDTPAALADFLRKQSSAADATPGDALVLALYLAREGTDDVAALAAFDKTLQVDQTNAAAWLELARLHTRLLDFGKALSATESGLAQHPEPKLALDLAKLRGRTLLRLGRSKEALEAWAALLQEHASDEDLADELIDLQADEGLESEAASQLVPLIARTKDAYLAAARRLKLGDLQLRLAKKIEARAAYAEALQQAAAGSWIEAEALARIDASFRREDDIKGLAAYLDTLAKANTQRLAIFKARAHVLAEQGDKDAALALYQDILQRSPGQRDLRESFLDLLERLDRYTDAIAQTKVLMEQNKTDKELHLRLATLQQKAGDKAASTASLDAYLAMPGVNEFDHLRVANMLDGWKRIDEAKARFAAVLATYPKSFEVLDAHAQFLHRSGERDAAIKAWQDMAKSADRDELMIIGSSLIARQEHRAAFDMLSARVNEFIHEPQFLAPLCQAALAAKQAKAAVPWALARVRSTDENTGLPDALKQAESVLKDADAIDSTLAELRAMPKLSLSDACLLSTLCEANGDLAGAEAALAIPDSAGASREERIRNLESGLRNQKVRLYYSRQEFGKAAEVLKEALATPEGRTAQNAQRRVDMLNRAGETEAAIAAIDQWKQLAPSAAQPFLMEAKMLRDLGRTEEALTRLRAANRKFADDDGVAGALADAYAELGQYAQTERIYLGLYEKASDQTAKLRAVKSLADAAMLRAEMTRLVGVFQERQRNNRADPLPWLALATIHNVADKSAEELAALIEAARLRPTDVQLAHKIARLQEDEGRAEEAVHTLERIASSDTTQGTRTLMALMQLRNGESDKGYEALAQLAGGSAMDARDAEMIADAMAGSGDWERMIAFLLPFVSKAPNDYRIGYQFAVALEEAGRDADAIREFARVVQLQDELPGFPKNKRTGDPWGDMWKSYPQGAYACLTMANDNYYAYQYRRQRSQMQRTKGGFLQIADGITAQRTRSAVHLFKLASSLDATVREQLGESLKTAGVEMWPLVAYGEQITGDWGIPTISSAALDRFPNDPLLCALWFESNDASPETMKRFRRVFDVLKKDYPAVAIDKAFAAMALDPSATMPLFDEASAMLPKLTNASAVGVWRLSGLVGGTQNLARDDDGGGKVTLTEEQASKVLAVLSSLHQKTPTDQSFRCASALYLMHALVRQNQWAALVDFFNAEIATYANDPKAMKAAGSMFSSASRRSGTLQPLEFPASSSLPPHLAAMLAWPDPWNPTSYGLMTPLPDGKGLLEHRAKLTDPLLRCFVAWWAGDSATAAKEAEGMIAKPAATARDFVFAAGLAQRMEQNDRALELLLKAAQLPMKAEDRSTVDEGLLYLVQQSKTLPEAAQEPARLAVRRVRTTSPAMQQALPELMEKLGMKEEGERLKRQLASGPIATRSSNYASYSNRQDASKRVDDYKAKGNMDAAARELLNAAGQFYTNYFQNNLGYALSQGHYETERHKDVMQHALAKLAKAATTAQKKMEYAAWLDIAGEQDKAREQFADIVKLQPQNALARGRLIMLTTAKDAQAGAKLMEDTPPAMLSSVIYGGMLDVWRNANATKLEERCALLSAVTRMLDKLAQAKAPLPLKSQGGLQELPAIARMSTDRDGPALQSNLDDRNPRDETADKAKLTLRRETHDALCKAMLRFPETAAEAFASLTCTQDEAWLIETARSLLQTGTDGKKMPSQSSVVASDADGVTRRWLPRPIEYLIAHAGRTGAIASIESDLMPLAERTTTSAQLKGARALADLWTCAEAAFPKALQTWDKNGGSNGNSSWQRSASATVPVEVWQQRKLTVPLHEVVADCMKQSGSGWQSPSIVVRYLTVLQERSPEQALAALDGIGARTLGEGDARRRRVSAFVSARYGRGSFNDQLCYMCNEVLESLARNPATIGLALQGAARLGFGADSRALQNLTSYLDRDAVLKNADTLLALLRSLSMLEEAPAFEPNAMSRSDAPVLANVLSRSSETSSAVADARKQLAQMQPQTFGIELCSALLAPSKDRAATVTAAIKKRGPDFAKVPEARRAGMAALLRWAVPGLKTPSTIDAAVVKSLEPILGSASKDQEKRVAKMLAATRFDDVGFDQSNSTSELCDEFTSLLVEVAQTDREKAKQLFLHVLPLAEARQAKEGLYGRSFWGGWTLRSAVISELIERHKSLDAVGFAFRMMAEDNSGLLKNGLGTNLNNASTAMMDAFRAAGGDGNVARGVNALCNKVGEALGDASGAALIGPFFEFANKLGPSQRIPALKWCAQKKHALAPDLDASLRLHLISNLDTRKNAAMQKELDSLGGVAAMWQHYREIVTSEKLSPQVRLAVLARVLRYRWQDAPPDLVVLGARMIAVENKAFHACGGDQEGRYILRAFARLPVNDEWQAIAKDLWDAWLVRNARNNEDARFNRNYHPDDETAEGMLHVAARSGHTEWCEKLLRDTENSQTNEPTAFDVLVQGGQHELAAKWMERSWAEIVYHANEGMIWNALIAEEMPKFAAACKRPDVALFGEIVANQLKDPPDREPGTKSFTERMKALVPRFLATKFADEKLRQRCLEYLCMEDSVMNMPELHAEFERSLQRLPSVGYTMPLGHTWKTWRATKPAAFALARQVLIDGNTQPALDLLPKMLELPSEQRSDLKEWTIGYQFGPILHQAERFLAANKPVNEAALLRVCEQLATKLPLHDRGTTESDSIAARAVSFILLHHARSGSMDGFEAWRKSLPPADAKRLKTQFLRSPQAPWIVLWNACGKPKAHVSAEERTQLVCKLLTVDWVQELFPAQGTNLPNVANILVNQQKLFTPQEYATAANAIATQFPRDGRTADGAAGLMLQRGALADAPPLFDLAISQTKDVNAQAGYAFRKAEGLERMNKKDEARAALNALPKDKLSANNKNKLETMLKRLGAAG